MEQDEENRMIEAENLEVSQHQLLVNTATGDDGDIHLDVMSERMESSVPNEEEDPFVDAKETSSLPLPTNSINSETLWLTEDVQASPEVSTRNIDANAENTGSGCSPSKGHIDGCFEVSGCSAFELAADQVEILSLHREVSEETEFVTTKVSAEPLAKADIRSHEENGETEVSGQVFAVSTSSFSQAKPTLEILTEEALGLVGSEFLSKVAVETESENLLHENRIEETKSEIQSQEDYEETEVSTKVIAESPNSFSQAEPTLEILTDEARGSELLTEVAVETEIENLLHQNCNGETKANVQIHEDNGETEVSWQVTVASPNSFSQAEPTLEILTEEARGLEVQSEVAIETESENVLHQTSNGETKVGSRQVSAVSDCLFAGNERLAIINTEDIQSLCSSWQSVPESEVGAPSEIWNDMNPAGDQSQKSVIEKEMKIQQMESEMNELKRQRDIAQCKLLDLERKAKELKGSNECEPISQGTLKRIERMFMNAFEEFISNIGSFVTGLKEDVAKLQYQKQLLFGQVSELEATETGAASESNTNDESQMDWPLGFEEQRKQIIMLWHLCHSSIIHRTQFFMLFKGDSPADQIYMEVELRRLTWIVQDLAELGNASPALLGDEPESYVASRIRALKQEREYLAKRVNTKLEEREMLYLKWDVPPVGKQRRHQFINKLWTDPHDIQHVKESAAIVAKLVGFCDPGAGEKIRRKEMFELNFASPSDKKMGWNFISNLLHL